MPNAKRPVSQKKGAENSGFKLVLSMFLFAIFLAIILALSYILYENLPGEPKSTLAVFRGVTLETGNLSVDVRQFYPNMKFNHNNISYSIDSYCAQDERKRMLQTFEELESRVGLIKFIEIKSGKPDIKVSCSNEEYSINEDYFIAGEGGAKEIIQTKRYNVITNGVILFHGNANNFLECVWPNIEIHELLHVLGFSHSQDSGSLMYPYLKSCTQKLDQSIITELKSLYSQPNLADLYFSEVSAIKSGRYLDFNVSIKNSGVIEAKKVFLSVIDSGTEIERFEMKDIPFGAGINFYVSNLKLTSRNSKDLQLVIDKDNFVREIDENNNVANLKFS